MVFQSYTLSQTTLLNHHNVLWILVQTMSILLGCDLKFDWNYSILKFRVCSGDIDQVTLKKIKFCCKKSGYNSQAVYANFMKFMPHKVICITLLWYKYLRPSINGSRIISSFLSTKLNFFQCHLVTFSRTPMIYMKYFSKKWWWSVSPEKKDSLCR